MSSKETRKVYMIADFCRYNVRQMILDDHPWDVHHLKSFSLHILQGLKVLHDMNVIHRDVKPSNIIYDDESNIYKLIDFGIATKFSSGINLNKIETLNQYHSDLSLIGTPGYISPEMYDSLYTLKKLTYTSSVDIFSFGITLLEMCIHDRAFRMDFKKLPEMIVQDISLKESMFQNIVENDAMYLKNMFANLNDVIKNKKLETLCNEIQEKIDILQQLHICDFDDKEMFLSELIDKNKTIFHCCQKMPQSLRDLDENTNIEYEFLYKLNALQKFAKRLDTFYNHSIDDLLNDYQFYPLLFMISSYQYPSSLQQITDPLLINFLQCCIHKIPSKRSNIHSLLNHPWLNS
jgi:serine/threonine protein kinase